MKKPIGSIFLALIAMLAMMFATVSLADKDTADEYFAIVKIARSGDAQEAAAQLQQFLEQYPEDSLADDAFLELGALFEKRLGDYDNAIATYERLLEDFPHSKSTRRAKPRLKKLLTERKGGDRPLQLYRDILQQYSTREPSDSLNRMMRLVNEYPEFPKLGDCVYWIADQYRRMDQYDESISWFQRVIREFPQSKMAFYATKSLGDVHVEFRDFDRARVFYTDLADYGEVSQFAQSASIQNLKAVDFFEMLLRLYYASLVVTVLGFVYLVAGISWAQRGNILGWKENWDLLLYAYCALILFALAVWRTPSIASLLVVLLLITSVILVLNRLYLSSRQLGKVAKGIHFFVILLLILGAVYAVFYAYDYVNITWDTIRSEYLVHL